MERLFVMLAAVLMFIGVGAGAFGAHGLSAHFARFPQLEATYGTAVRYHLIHGLALFGVGLAAARWPGPWLQWSGYLLLAGIIIFSGSLYLLKPHRRPLARRDNASRWRCLFGRLALPVCGCLAGNVGTDDEGRRTNRECWSFAVRHWSERAYDSRNFGNRIGR
jgi:uncharacterized membrane protein YgdD (TMEM256/DUF423 family)